MYIQLFSAGSKSVAKTTYFHKNIILTKRKIQALSFVGSLTSISHCSIWNTAIGNEGAKGPFAVWMATSLACCCVHTPIHVNACTKQVRTKRGYRHHQRPSSLPITLMCTGFDNASCSYWKLLFAIPRPVRMMCKMPQAPEGNNHFQSVR